MDKHIIEAMGKSKITIENGKVTNVEKPNLEYCPLFHHHRNIEKINEDIIEENINFRIKDFGMCTENREIRMKDYLSFGISETLNTLLNEDIIDCAIMVCEGCGTVLVTEGELAQGIGGRVSGLVETSPINEIIEKVGRDNVVYPETAEINQIEGFKKAVEKGYKNIAVTIALNEDGNVLRELESKYENVNLYLFAVHTTGLTRKESEDIFKTCDVITSCASKHLRDIANENNVYSVGSSIPIYGASNNGEKFLKIRLKKINKKEAKNHKANPPYPLS